MTERIDVGCRIVWANVVGAQGFRLGAFLWGRNVHHGRVSRVSLSRLRLGLGVQVARLTGEDAKREF